MRRSFRQFINEITFSKSGYGAGSRFGIWKLPNLQAGTALHLHMPPGGFQTFGQLGQHISNKLRFQDEDYVLQHALQKFAELAENSTVAISNRAKGVADPTGHYEHARIEGQSIVGLKEQDIISGLFPRLKQEDMERGQEMGILLGPNNSKYQGYYDLRVDVLRDLMEKMEEKIANKEYGHQSIAHLTGTADKIAGLASNGGMVPSSRGADTLSGH